MKMNCIAVDDEVLALKKIKRYAEKIDYLNLLGKRLKCISIKFFILKECATTFQIHTEESKIMTLLNFKTIQDLLDPQKFIRVHKSYIVAIDKIDYIENSAIKIRDKLIPVSSSYKIAFNSLLNKKNFTHL